MLKIVDSHHKVLTAWAEYRKTLDSAPRLITLDHHTDTSPPFRNFIKNNFRPEEFNEKQTELLNQVDFENKNTVFKAVEKLSNDEHIVTAIKADIVSSAFVVAHNAANTDLRTYSEHKIACKNINNSDSVLETEVLNEAFKSFEGVLTEACEPALFKNSYILDIDLDYFNTFKAVAPNDSSLFESVLKNAGLITIATEPEYVKNCALDSGLTSEYLLEKLLSYI